MRLTHRLFGSIISMVASRVELKLGRCLHGQILRAAFYLDAHVETSLIVMYLKGGKIDIAFRMFEIWSVGFQLKFFCLKMPCGFSPIALAYILVICF